MNSFLKTVNSLTNKRDILVKESLQKQLNTVVMEMQSAPGVEDDGIVSNCEETMTLCSVLEAVFLHGLKDSLLNRVTEVLSGPDFDAVPQPSFWGPLLVFSHRQIIDQIQSFSQLTTEVGYCRAWIRLALNEGLLASYFYSIRKDNSALKPYYNRSAFIRDTDFVEVAQRLIENLDYIHFEVACNSSLLNFWSNTPLLLAGIWSPPMKSCPVFSAVDIAKTITTELPDGENFDEVETASSIGSLGSFNSSQSALNNVANIIEDEALKIILTNKKSNNIGIEHFANNSRNTPPLKEEEEQNVQEEEKQEVENEISNNSSPKINVEINKVTNIEDSSIAQNHESSHDVAATAVGNSLIGRLGWSTSYEDCDSSLTSSIVSHESKTDAPRTPAEGPTYDAIIQSYHTAGNTSVPDLQEFLKKYPKRQPTDDGTKVQSEKVVINFDDQLKRLPREKGLDVQNYSCLECGHAIGMTFSKAHVCSYSGSYYCSKCMSQNEYIIPSRVIHNWDLKRYPVCNNAATYLHDCPTLLDLKSINPRIYMAVDTMAQLQSLRIQLNLLRAYLFTCREPIIESLQRKVAPRDYLYEHVHQYSVSDLLDIPNGTLAQQLQKVVEFARNHVINCWLCSQKGFICEICNNPKVIYPFDMESTYRCGACNAVFHAECLNANKPCPKCERRRKRMDLPLLDVGRTELSVNSAPTTSNNTTQ
ncbi:pleckstrin homology domain-containing family M member 1 isoform X1 [Osmia bicornis bicornis]|uniref:pleckstrin homology domain-containing family M member 1 isoform X1 n=1 Tax=Osmia bicornis bicornis TaxID=1437191 RepID=UPI001EAF2032|nr:pleckstrin homology domain-containing family M member 1 isoform X1 [Osmia bicornis bicornis]